MNKQNQPENRTNFVYAYECAYKVVMMSYGKVENDLIVM
jgi:hypothetical protein